MPDVEVGVLGALRVTVAGVPVEVSGPLPRRLLAVLASSVGQTVPADRIADALWRGEPPAGATQTLQSHVARLRRQLPEGVIETCPEGYRLHAVVDADVFEHALARGDTDRLVVLLGDWRGPAYDGLADDGLLARESERLAVLRNDAVARIAQAHLDENRLDGLHTMLESALATQPTQEPLWELLMLLLYRQGRAAEALTAYQRARLALREELGVDPGVRLRELEHAILVRDPRLLPSADDHGDTSSQRRRVAVLVMEPLEADDDAAEDLAAERRALHELISGHGGIVLASPGALVYAVFGTPRAHEDDPQRASNAGRVALSRRLARRAGLATGQGVVDEEGDLVAGSRVARRAEALCLASRPGRIGTDDASKAVLKAAPGAEPSQFVGRKVDLADLDEEFHRSVARGRSQLVTLIAEAGMGKSRLAREFLQMLPPDVHVVSVRCPAYGEATGRQVIAELVGRDIEEGQPSVYDAFRFGFEELARLAGGRPQVVHVDDLHWADDLLVDFLGGLVEHAATRPLQLVVAARPELTTSRPDWAARAPAARTMRLDRLTDEETTELVRDLGGDESVVARTGGVPLHALELTRITTGATPDSLRAVVAARIDTLSPEARGLLVDVAVVGDSVIPEAVAAIGGGSTDRVGRLLDELVARDFLRRDTDRLRFSHDVVRETAYGTLVRRDRARKHLAVATWASGADHEMGNAWWAWHALTGADLAEEAGLPQMVEDSRSVVYAAAVAAGKDVLLLDNQTALRFFERALDVAAPGLDAAWARSLAGIAQHELRRFVEADELLTAGVAGLDGESDEWRAIALAFLTSARFGLGTDFDGAVALLREGLTEVPMTAGSIFGYSMDGVCELVKQTPGAFAASREIAERHLAQAHALGLDAHAGTLHTVRGRARVAQGDGEGLEEMVMGVELAERHDRPMLAVVARTYLAAALHHWRGPAAELAAREAMEEWAVAHNSHYVVSYSTAERVRCLAELGRWREVVSLADTVDLAEAQPRWAAVQRALALHELGELTLADVELVRRTPPASDDDLRHVLGTALVEAIWEPARVDELADGLGDLTPYAERDGAMELLPRLIRMAPHRDYTALWRTDESTPLAAALTPHINGLVSNNPTLLLLAAERWRALGQTVEADLAAADAAAAAAPSDPRSAETSSDSA